MEKSLHSSEYPEDILLEENIVDYDSDNVAMGLTRQRRSSTRA